MSFKKEYFEDGFICPCCGKEEVSSTDEPCNHGASISQSVHCLSCDERWIEYYELVRTKMIHRDFIIIEKDK